MVVVAVTGAIDQASAIVHHIGHARVGGLASPNDSSHQQAFGNGNLLGFQKVDTIFGQRQMTQDVIDQHWDMGPILGHKSNEKGFITAKLFMLTLVLMLVLMLMFMLVFMLVLMLVLMLLGV